MKMNALIIPIFLIFCDALPATLAGGMTKSECLKEGGMTKKELGIKKKSEIPDLKLKCYYRCILEKDELIADNKIIPGAYKKIVGPMLTPEKLAEVESSCHSENAFGKSIKDKCDFGHLLFKCYSSHTKKDLRVRQIKYESESYET